MKLLEETVCSQCRVSYELTTQYHTILLLLQSYKIEKTNVRDYCPLKLLLQSDKTKRRKK